ncbi:hypothetical protein JU57_12700 [Sulfurospirillum sp. SCADC]|nr:hypothetical protein JU57_12700 [Sulfurospirillum sp. SCADC]
MSESHKRVLAELSNTLLKQSFKATLTLGFLRQKAHALLVLFFLQIEFCKKSKDLIHSKAVVLK